MAAANCVERDVLFICVAANKPQLNALLGFIYIFSFIFQYYASKF